MPVWLYLRFSPSLRNVEELLAERSVRVTYETIRARCAEFGSSYAAGSGVGAHGLGATRTSMRYC
jgi:transposase-like protein